MQEWFGKKINVLIQLRGEYKSDVKDGKVMFTTKGGEKVDLGKSGQVSKEVIEEMICETIPPTVFLRIFLFSLFRIRNRCR